MNLLIFLFKDSHFSHLKTIVKDPDKSSHLRKKKPEKFAVFWWYGLIGHTWKKGRVWNIWTKKQCCFFSSCSLMWQNQTSRSRNCICNATFHFVSIKALGDNVLTLERFKKVIERCRKDTVKSTIFEQFWYHGQFQHTLGTACWRIHLLSSYYHVYNLRHCHIDAAQFSRWPATVQAKHIAHIHHCTSIWRQKKKASQPDCNWWLHTLL